MSTSGREGRTEAVLHLLDVLVLFSQALRARGTDWHHAGQGLTRGDVVTLGVLDARGSCRPGRIAAVLGVDPSVVSRQLVGLARLGLIARGPDPDDGRAERIALTDAGRSRLQEARAAMCAVLAERLEQWEVADLVRAAAMVEDLAARLHQPIAPSAPTLNPAPTTEDHALHV